MRWVSELHRLIGVVAHLPRLRVREFDHRLDALMGRDVVKSTAETFETVLAKVEGDSLPRSFSVVESTLEAAQTYVGKWLAYQSLWDLESARVEESLGEDMKRWHALLSDLIRARKSFDTTASSRQFGPITIKFDEVGTS